MFDCMGWLEVREGDSGWVESKNNKKRTDDKSEERKLCAIDEVSREEQLDSVNLLDSYDSQDPLVGIPTNPPTIMIQPLLDSRFENWYTTSWMPASTSDNREWL